jgi:signal transduction histidine kinase
MSRQARDAGDRSEPGAGGALPQQRDKSQAHLQQAQRLENLGQLAGGVAHDFNNLLGVILNYASFAPQELEEAGESDWAARGESARADLGQISRAGERAAGLTRQLLSFARREVMRPQVLDLDTAITAVEDMLRRTLGEHVELVTSLAGNLDPVLADPGQLEQVLVNLVVNARDAMPGGGTLTIDTGNVTVDAESIAGGSKSRAGQHVRLLVSDTGTGMPTEVIEHAFEPFFTTKEEGAGTGLGLATVYGIVTQADGHIRIYSSPASARPSPSRCPLPPRHPPRQRTAEGETILVVEDEAALREVTRRVFTRKRLPGDHRRQRPRSPQYRPPPPRRDPPARHRRRHAPDARQGGRRENAGGQARHRGALHVRLRPARPGLPGQARPRRGPGRETVLRGRPPGQGRAGTQRPPPQIHNHRQRPAAGTGARKENPAAASPAAAGGSPP